MFVCRIMSSLAARRYEHVFCDFVRACHAGCRAHLARARSNLDDR